MRRLVFLLPIAIVAVLVALFWIGLDPKRDKSMLPSALVGHPAPAVDLPGLADGAPRLTLTQFKGQLVAVNFFASWCLPCRAEHPLLKQITAEFGVPVIGEPDGKGGWVVRVYHEPLVSWIWFGALIMVAGGFTSLSDRRYRVGAPVRAGAAQAAKA